jgi:DNA-binding HxlR family transcriptional regulator
MLLTATSTESAMTHDCYVSFCPTAKACEILEPRWTLLVLCEMFNGSTHFNDIRRGVPAMSPTLLSKRLKELERHGLLTRVSGKGPNANTYHLTQIAKELEPIIDKLGDWAHRNIDTEVKLERLDANVLMWNMRRKVDTAVLPRNRRSVIQFIYPELPEYERNYWLISRPGHPVDMCMIDPGHDVELYVTADLRAMTSAWMGMSTLQAEINAGKIELVGNDALISSIGDWMVRSRFATLAAA